MQRYRAGGKAGNRLIKPLKPTELKRVSLKKAADLVGVDRAVIVDLVSQGCPRNKNGTINVFKLTAWLLHRGKGG